jgi:hypothetical protein
MSEITPEKVAATPLTGEQLENATRMAAKVVETFGDAWELHYDPDTDEVSCRTDDEGPIEGSYLEVFSTSQWPSDMDHSPVAEFLCASIVMVPGLVGEVERLKSVAYTQARMISELTSTCMAAELEWDARLKAEEVERFLKRERDEHEPRGECWNTVDDVLDCFRLHMVTGTPLTDPRPEEGPTDATGGHPSLTEAEELRAVMRKAAHTAFELGAGAGIDVLIGHMSDQGMLRGTVLPTEVQARLDVEHEPDGA